MYTKNDYRYYLEHRLKESDDYFAHYGIKGMKWKHHIYAKKYENEEEPGTYIYEVGNKKTGKYIQGMRFRDKEEGDVIRVNTNIKRKKKKVKADGSEEKITKRITKRNLDDGNTGYDAYLGNKKQRRQMALNNVARDLGWRAMEGRWQAKRKIKK